MCNRKSVGSRMEPYKKYFVCEIINASDLIINLANALYQTVLSIYYQRNHSKQFMQTIIREIIQKIYTNCYHRNHSKQFLQTITREIIPHNSYKPLSQKSFQTMLSNYYQRNHSKEFLKTIVTEIIPINSYKLLQEKSFQKMPIHYDKHYTLCLKTINGKTHIYSSVAILSDN